MRTSSSSGELSKSHQYLVNRWNPDGLPARLPEAPISDAFFARRHPIILLSTTGRSRLIASRELASSLLARPACFSGLLKRLPPTNLARPQESPVAAATWIRYTYLSRFSRPAGTRQLYRLVKRQQICRVVEVGIGDIGRAIALIEVAQRYAGERTVWYTGIDWFDTRQPGQTALPLKDAYRDLRATGANVRLVPGAPGRSLAAAANAHQNTDLILIGPGVAEEDLRGSWFYVPRMLHDRTAILTETHDAKGESSFTALSRSQVAEWAVRDSSRRAA
jgi:hypothetical protein